MSLETLLFHLRELECELHRPHARRSRAQLQQLLHPEFFEFSRSGKTYSLAQI